jgi:hypothetical protein
LLDGSASKALEMYRKLGPDIFPSKHRGFLSSLFIGAKYGAKKAEAALARVFEDSVTVEALATAETGGRQIASLMLTLYDMVRAARLLTRCAGRLTNVTTLPAHKHCPLPTVCQPPHLLWLPSLRHLLWLPSLHVGER